MIALVALEMKKKTNYHYTEFEFQADSYLLLFYEVGVWKDHTF